MSPTKSPIIKVVVKKKNSAPVQDSAPKVERKNRIGFNLEEMQKKPLAELIILRDQNLEAIIKIKNQLDAKTKVKNTKRNIKLLKWKLSAEVVRRKKGMLVNRLNPIIKELKAEERQQRGIRFERIFMDKAREYLSADMMKKLMDETHSIYDKQVV